MVQKDPCTPMFIATLFTTAKTWKQPKCPLKEEWIKMWYIYTMEYHSAIDLEIVILSEVSQKEKENYHDITYM